MAYLALYRKWRPRTFSEVIGQDAIMTALKNQVKSGRIGHAYLFCGTRGTGKTSTAKIFARAVNCLHPVDGDPCNQCELCLEGESDFNVIEIDAASNNGVDSIRELREEVRYAPSRGKYKVYIIDEVHMLSTSAFNALLKTLEEPPAHVIFILATTEPHKLLPTILSRCQRYDFRRISAKDLTGQLIRLSKAEGIDADEAALSYIADAADGASRDALSILDQCAAFYMDQRITLEKVLDVLGATDRRLFYTMTGILLTHDKTACLKELEELFASGKDTSRFLLDWISYLRNILLLQMMGDEALSFFVAPESEIAGLRENAGRTGPETISYYIEELSKLELSLRGAAERGSCWRSACCVCAVWKIPYPEAFWRDWNRLRVKLPAAFRSRRPLPYLPPPLPLPNLRNLKSRRLLNPRSLPVHPAPLCSPLSNGRTSNSSSCRKTEAIIY